VIQLRVRTEFSFKSAFGPIDRVAKSLASIGCTAAGIVDFSTWGHVKWAAACKKHGVTPLFGAEIIVPQEDGRQPTCWVLAKKGRTKEFYNLVSATKVADANVIKLLTAAKGKVIRFSGAALTDPKTFDYVDVNPASILAQRAALALSMKTKRPLVVTSDNYYPLAADKGPFLAMGGRERNTPQHLLSEPETAFPGLSPGQISQAVKQAATIAKECASALLTAPLIKVKGDIRKVAEAGRKSRLDRGHIEKWTKEYADRLERELVAIEAKEYQSYFLVVADLVTWAKTKMLVGPARGSSAGSLLCYLVGITEVDPIKHNLLFERFIDLTRKDLPDIDIDFNDNKRELIFQYLCDKYGKANVARIGNINTFKPRSLMQSAFSRLGIPDHERFNLVNVLVNYSSGDERYGKGIEDTFKTTDIGRRFMEKYPEAAVITQIENHASHTGVHAAGIIVSMEPVIDYCTVADGIAHLDKPDAEALNLLKIDALGLRTLGVIEDAGVTTADELYSLQLNDPKVLAVFNDKKFSSVFQFEGMAQRSVTAVINVDSFETLDHITALARPGPLGGGAAQKYIERKAGREPITTSHPLLGKILEDTYGVALYQEQILKIVRELGGFSWEDTTTIRKAMSGRKGEEYFNRMGLQFTKGAKANGIKENVAKEIWGEIVSFGSWAMNKCVAGNQKVLLARRLNDGRKTIPISEFSRFKTLPSVWALQKDGRARWAKPVALHHNGKRQCFRYEFDDGSRVDCTPDHKFLINEKWRPISKAAIGSRFTALAAPDKKGFREKLGIGYIKGRRSKNPKFQSTGKDHPGWIDGRSYFFGKFRAERMNSPCDDCGRKKKRMETHHNDFKQGTERPNDLAWLCPSCHAKRHRSFGNRLDKGRRGRPTIFKSLTKISSLGLRDTYDLEMPSPNHNFALANDLITSNSHTCSYAMISYYCAWMKAYHPLEYAAACLRGAKDDDGRLAVLREMTQEGVAYVAFDMKRSQLDWTVQDGKLIGGFLNFHGVGPAKASSLIKMRDEGKYEALTKKLAEMKLKFNDLYPLLTAYGDLYDEHKALTSNKFPEEGKVVYIAKIVDKRPFDFNEAVRIAKRDGKVYSGNTLAIDFRTQDDFGETIICRVDRFNWKNFGEPANNALAVGDDIIVRGRRIKGFAMLNVIRIKCLNKPDLEWAVKPRW
jgi:hypothetical protein